MDNLPREPRCRICRDPELRRLVNEMLDWRTIPIRLRCGRTHAVTYRDILDDLERLNEGRDKSDRITYDCLWIHAKGHYELNGTVAYWGARIYKELRKGIRG